MLRVCFLGNRLMTSTDLNNEPEAFLFAAHDQTFTRNRQKLIVYGL